MNTIAYDRGLSARANGGRSSAPSPSSSSALRRTFRAIRLSPWAPVIGKSIVGIAALLALAALGQAALVRPAAAESPAMPSLSPAGPAHDPQPSETEAPPLLAAAAQLPEREIGPPPKPEVPEAGAVLPDGRIVLNLANETELTKLPGIGPKRAQAILAVRQRLGRFRRVEDLLRVKGIGRKMLDRIRPTVVLDPPPPD